MCLLENFHLCFRMFTVFLKRSSQVIAATSLKLGPRVLLSDLGQNIWTWTCLDLLLGESREIDFINLSQDGSFICKLLRFLDVEPAQFQN